MVTVLPKPPKRQAGQEAGEQSPVSLPDDKTIYLPAKPTDDQIGDALIRDWCGRYAYFYSQWQEYQGGVWLPAENLMRDIWEKLKYLRRDGGCHELRPSQNRANGVEAYLREYLRADEPAENLTYINLRNGVYNLDTNELEPHRADLFMTSQLPFDYDPDAGCPRFLRFIRQMLISDDAEPDEATIRVLQEAMGYTLTASTAYRVSFWLVGESGSGKSTLLNVLIALAGNSHAPIDLDAMSTNPYQIADIAGKRLVTFTEPKTNAVLADNHYKRLVSQDKVTARQIFGKPFSFVPVCKVWGAMNRTPRVVDRSDAVFNRVVIIPMNYVMPRHLWDLTIDAKLAAELPGIFAWALIGLKRLQKDGKFSHSEQIERARTDYKEENDTEAAFVSECAIRGDENWVTAKELYAVYNNWCKENGTTAKSATSMAHEWKRLGFRKDRTEKARIWRGVALNPDVRSWGIT